MDLTPSQQPAAAAGASGGSRLAGPRLAGAIRSLARVEHNLTTLAVPAWSVAAATAVLGVYALVLYFRADLTLVQGDAIGHLYVARRVIDSVTPSFAQFGYIWLPLPHLLMIPFVWNDTLWQTGLAGSIVSLIAFALSAAYVYRTVHAISGNGIAGMLCAALFATNPNLLFMQTTPMGEAVTLFFVIAATYHLVRWAQDRSQSHLIASAAFVLGGTLSRYEVWWLVPFGVAVVALTSLKHDGFGRHIEGLTITWGMLASYGIVLWLIYNQVIFGDPLHFIPDLGAAQSFPSERASEGVLPTKASYIGSAKLYGWAVIDIAGLPLVLAGVVGFFALMVSRLSLGVKLAMLLPATLFLFEVVSLTKAQSAMLSPHSSIPAFVNTRYGLLLLPALVITAGAVAKPLRLAGVAILFAALVPQLMILPTPDGIASLREDELARAKLPHYSETWRDTNFPLLQKDRPAALVEAVVASGESRKAVNAEADWINSHAGAGKILISEHFHASALMLYSGLPLSHFIYEGNKPYFQQELQSPGRNTSWIVYQPAVAGDEIRPLLAGARPAGFELVFEDDQIQIFHRRAPVDDVPRPAVVPPTAQLIDYDISIDEVGAVDPAQTLYALRCADGTATLATTRAVIYARMPCDELPDDSALAGKPVGLRITPGGDFTRVRVASGDADPLRFNIRYGWIEFRGDAPDVPEADDVVPRPESVPPAARRLVADTTIGDTGATDAAHVLYGIRCKDDVTAVTTTHEVLYADLPCTDTPNDHELLSQTVAIHVTPAEGSSAVRIDSAAAGSITFDAPGVWLDDRTDRDQRAPQPRPPAVPASARTIWGDTSVGAVRDDTQYAHTLYGVRCADGVATVITTKETLYAELPCPALPDDHPLLSLPVLLTVRREDDGWHVNVETHDAGTLTFVTGRVWLLSQ